jgi:hypothetical protein
MPEDPEKKSLDVVLLQSRTDDGEGVRVVRVSSLEGDGAPPETAKVEAGEIRPLKDGKPLGSGEIVKLAPREKAPWICDVEVAARVETPETPRVTEGRGRPPQIASEAYRASWERIFGPRALN